MDQLIQFGGHSSSYGIHHRIHLFLHHLHILDHVHRTYFYFGGAADILQTIPSIRDIAFFLVFPLLSASR